MNKLILLLFLTSLVNSLYGQSKISYLDARFQETEKRKALYEMTETEQNDSILKTIRFKEKKNIKATIIYSKEQPNFTFQTEFGSKGIKLNEGRFNKGKKDGNWLYFNDQGILSHLKYFNEDVEFNYISYFPNGQKRKEVGVFKGEYEGLCTYYDLSGNIILQGNYKKTRRISDFKYFYTSKDSSLLEIADTNHSKDSSNTGAEILPEFPGGQSAMLQYVANNLDYPEEAKNRGVEGKINVKFTVRKDGIIYDAFIISKETLGYGCERSSIEVIENMPNWTPGMSQGKPVPVYFNMPLHFRLY